MTITPQAVEDFKKFEKALYEEAFDESVEDFEASVLERSIEEYDLAMEEYQEQPLTLNGNMLGMEAREEPLAKKVKSTDVVGKDGWVDPKSVTNKSKIAAGEKTVYQHLISLHEEDYASNGVRINILSFIQSYLTSQMDGLACRGPSRRVNWLPSHGQEWFSRLHTKESEVKDGIKKSKAIQPNWQVATNPFNMIGSFLVSYYWSHKTPEEKKLPPERTLPYMICLLLTVRFYSSLQKRQFPYDPDEELMNQVIEDMNKRHIIKSMNNVFELLQMIAYTNVENMVDTIENPVDFNLHYFLTNLQSRINHQVKAIATLFYKAHSEGRRGGTTDMKKENPDKEGDIYLEVPENISDDIMVITRKILLKMASDHDVDHFSLDVACKRTKVNKEKVRIAILEMKDKYPDLLGRLIKNILAYYLGSLKQPKRTIKSKKFLNLMSKAYSVSNTGDEFILTMKEILDELLTKASADFRKTTRKATLSNLRSACYLYTILYLARYTEG